MGLRLAAVMLLVLTFATGCELETSAPEKPKGVGPTLTMSTNQDFADIVTTPKSFRERRHFAQDYDQRRIEFDGTIFDVVEGNDVVGLGIGTWSTHVLIKVDVADGPSLPMFQVWKEGLAKDQDLLAMKVGQQVHVSGRVDPYRGYRPITNRSEGVRFTFDISDAKVTPK